MVDTTAVVPVQQTSTDVVIPNPDDVRTEMMERSEQIKLRKEDAHAVVAYTEASDDLRNLITKFLPTFKLSEHPVSEEKLKKLFLEVSAMVGECRDRQMEVQANMKTSAQFGRKMKDKYNAHVADVNNNLTWTEHHTKQDREALEKIMEGAAALIKAQKSSQSTIRQKVEEINELVIGVGFKGQAEQAKNDEHTQTMEKELLKFTQKIEENEKLLVEFTKQYNEVNMSCQEQKTILDDTEVCNENHDRRTKSVEALLKKVQGLLASQEKALADEIEQVEEEFKNNVTQQRDIRAMFEKNIKAARQKIVEMHTQQLTTIGQEITTSVDTITEEQLSTLKAQTHFICIVDESSSMGWSSGIISKLFSSNTSTWDVLKKYMKDFLNGAPKNLSSNDRISCVGFSSKAITRMEGVTPDQAPKFANNFWSPAGGGTYLAQAFSSARQMAQRTPKHRIVYIMLTDGHICDQKECLNQCTAIGKETQAGVEKPMLFSVGLGSNSNESQLTELVTAANGSLQYEFAGEKICDLMQVCELTEEGAQRLQSIFTTVVTKSVSRKVEIIKTQIKLTEQYIEQQEIIKQKMMKGGQQSAQQVQDLINEIKQRYEIEQLQGLRQREQSLHDQLKTLRDVLKASQVTLNQQSVKLQQDEVELRKIQSKKDEIAHQITIDQELKTEVQRKLDELAATQLKNIEAHFQIKDQDENISKAAKLKVIIDRINMELLKSVLFYDQINLFFDHAIKGELNMNQIVNKGIKQDEIKKQMIKAFMHNDPASYQDIDLEDLRTPLIADDLSTDDKMSIASEKGEKFASLKTHFNKNFDENPEHVAKFDNPSWVAAQLAMKFNIKDEKLEILYNLLQACTFNQLVEGMQNEKVPDVEKEHKDRIRQQLDMHYKNTKVQLEHEIKNNTKKLKTGKQRLEDIAEEVKALEKKQVQLDESIVNFQNGMRPGRSAAQIKKLEKQIKEKGETQNEVEKVKLPKAKEEYEEELANINKKISKNAEEEDEELTEKLKNKKQQIEDAWAEKEAELKGTVDELGDEIADLAGQIDTLKQGKSTVPIDQAKQKIEKGKKELLKLEEESNSIEEELAKIKQRVGKLSDEKDKIDALIDIQMGHATFIINQIRDLANDSYRKASESIYKQLLNELATQLNKLFEPLGVFFVQTDLNHAIDCVRQSAGMNTLMITN